MEYKYMCISCGDLVCELIRTIKIDVPTKCPGTGKKIKWVFIQREEAEPGKDLNEFN